MEFRFKSYKWTKDSDGSWLMFLVTPFMLEDFLKWVKDAVYVCVIKEHKEKRSLNANGYLWHLVNELGNVMRIGKEECYTIMLKRYGQSTVVSVLDKAVDLFKRSVKYCDDFGESELNGKVFRHIKVYMGSSDYDTKQMAILLDGVISECKEVGISTITPAELAIMKNEWGAK